MSAPETRRGRAVVISGPHGSGKTTLIERLLLFDPRFVLNDFEIDFVTEFPTFAALDPGERGLFRLYHRMYVVQRAEAVARRGTHDVIVSRGTLDSEAYAEAYRGLGWISARQYALLRSVVDHYEAVHPCVVLCPPLDVVRLRLRGRQRAGTRPERDRVFAPEDTDEFLAALHASYAGAASRPNVLLITDNELCDLRAVTDWLDSTASPVLAAT